MVCAAFLSMFRVEQVGCGFLDNESNKNLQSVLRILSLVIADPAFPKGVPLARLVDPGMVAAMSETVLAHVLDWHRHHYYYRAQQEARVVGDVKRCRGRRSRDIPGMYAWLAERVEKAHALAWSQSLPDTGKLGRSASGR